MTEKEIVNKIHEYNSLACKLYIYYLLTTKIMEIEDEHEDAVNNFLQNQFEILNKMQY